MEIITSLEFLGRDKLFPPVKSMERLKAYKMNNTRYKGMYNKDRRLVIKTADGNKVIDWKIPAINYYKLVTDKFVGLILNELPIIGVTKKDWEDELNDVIVNTTFWLAFQEVARTFSSLGDGVLYVYNDNGRPGINAVNPEFWYKIVMPNNINCVKCHVLVQPIYEERFDGALVKDEIKALRIMEHYKGYYIERYVRYDGIRLGEPIEYDVDYVVDIIGEDGKIKPRQRIQKIPKEGIKIATGINDFAVIDFNNSKAVDEVYGRSDYEIFKDVLELKEKKVSQIDCVTDKHVDPIVQVPYSAIEENEETGRAEFNGFGNWIAVREGEEIKYVSWDAKTDTVMSLINKLDDEVAVLSEMGKAFLFGEYANVSGEALKTMIKSALDKAARQIKTIEPAVKRALCAMLNIVGVSAKPSDITIVWQDGITETELTLAQTAKAKIEAGLISKKRAIMTYEGLTEEEAERDIENMIKEKQIEKQIEKEVDV